MSNAINTTPSRVVEPGAHPAHRRRRRQRRRPSPPYLPNGFETFEQAKERRRHRRKVLRKGDRRARFVARVLRDCWPETRCSSEACPVCMRKFRKRFCRAATKVIASSPEWTRASVIPSGLAVPLGKLNSVNVPNLVKALRKRIERSPYLRNRVVVGGLDVSLNVKENVVQHWQLHLYLLIEAKRGRRLRAAVRTAFPPEPTAARPYRFRTVRDFAAASSYAYKSIFNRRSSYEKDGKPRTRNLPIKNDELRELCTFLDSFPIGARLILRGVRRNGEKLQTVKTKQVSTEA
ncbi:MAG TPA: hypothetical protein VK456_03755 [Xanthobacteraceae bacterium]|nr:hypothetical protein [Xanthobacteraceae bacterium]